MFVRITVTLLASFQWAAANAQTVSPEDIVGVWEYESYAAIETPQDKRRVGAKMDFRGDGTVVMTLSTGKAEGTYAIDGNTIVYSDADGRQEWHVRSYKPGNALVIEYQRALMFFRKSASESP